MGKEALFNTEQKKAEPVFGNPILQSEQINEQKQISTSMYDLFGIQRQRERPALQPGSEDKESMQKKQIFSLLTEFSGAFLENWENSYQRILDLHEKRSNVSKELRNAAVEMKNMCEGMVGLSADQVPLEQFLDCITRLSQVTDAYYDCHRGYEGYFDWMFKLKTRVAITGSNEVLSNERKKIALGIRGQMRELIDRITQAAVPDFENELQTEVMDKTASETPSEMSSSVKIMKNFAGQYKYYTEIISRELVSKSPEDLIEDKMTLLRVYEKHIFRYRRYALEHSIKIPREVQKVMDDYDECRRLMALSKWRKSHLTTKKVAVDTISDTISKHLEEEEGTKDSRLSGEETDRNLSKEQLKAIQEIDEWLIMNFHNGGIVGSLLGEQVDRAVGIKNDNRHFIRAMMTKTKRERLHMYYLVETNARKNPSLMDVGASQMNYVPSLKNFKNRMIATKWKINKYLVGDYVYMNKLSEAYQITMRQSDMIKSTSKLREDIEKEKFASKAQENENQDKRLKLMRENFVMLNSYRSYLEEVSSQKDKRKRKWMEKKAGEMAGEIQRKFKELVVEDKKIADQSKNRAEKEKAQGADQVPIMEYQAVQEQIGAIGDANSIVKGIGGNLNAPFTFTEKTWGFGWGLDRMGFENFQLWTGSIDSSLGVAGGLISATTTIYSMAEVGSSMTKTDFAEKILDIAQTLTGMATKFLTGLENANNIKDITLAAIDSTAKAVTTSPALTALSAGSAAINGIKGAVQIGSAVKMQKHLNKAGEYFENKHSQKKIEGKPQTKEEIRQYREQKYEKCMVKLAQRLQKKKASDGIFNAINAVTGTLAVFVPGVGATVFAVVGGIASAAKFVKDLIEKNARRNAIFDSFFNMDGLADRILELRKANASPGALPLDKEELKNTIRYRVAAAAGFADKATAENYICDKFSNMIRERLFGRDKEEVPKELSAEEQAEKNAYIELVGAFDLKYNAKKKTPSYKALMRKMRAM